MNSDDLRLKYAEFLMHRTLICQQNFSRGTRLFIFLAILFYLVNIIPTESTTPSSPEESTTGPIAESTTPSSPEESTTGPIAESTTPASPEESTTGPIAESTTPASPEESTTGPIQVNVLGVPLHVPKPLIISFASPILAFLYYFTASYMKMEGLLTKRVREIVGNISSNTSGLSDQLDTKLLDIPGPYTWNQIQRSQESGLQGLFHSLMYFLTGLVLLVVPPSIIGFFGVIAWGARTSLPGLHWLIILYIVAFLFTFFGLFFLIEPGKALRSHSGRPRANQCPNPTISEAPE